MIFEQGPRGYVTAAGICASSFSILSLIRNSANSAATRIAFLIAFAFEEPWVIKHTPLTPSKGAPPYSVWSSRFLKSAKALRDSKYPTCRVIVAFKLSFNVARTRFATPSEVFSATLPTKPSATITSTFPLYRSRPSTFPMKFNGKQPDAWPPRAEHAPEIDFPHHRELLKVLWLAINIGSDIKENCHRSHGRRNHCRQRGTIHPRQPSQHHFGGGHCCAGIACRHKSRCLAFAHQPKPYTQGRIPRGPDGLDSF